MLIYSEGHPGVTKILTLPKGEFLLHICPFSLCNKWRIIADANSLKVRLELLPSRARFGDGAYYKLSEIRGSEGVVYDKR